PFIVNQSLRAWEPPVIEGRTLPRIAGISSFGAGGSNAHLIVEEFPAPVEQPIPVTTVGIVLSARTPEQLRQKARDLFDFVRAQESSIDLAGLAYTLQVGREAMEERLGFVVSSAKELAERLRGYVDGEAGEIHRGEAVRNAEVLSLFSTDADLKDAIEKWVAN